MAVCLGCPSCRPCSRLVWLCRAQRQCAKFAGLDGVYDGSDAEAADGQASNEHDRCHGQHHKGHAASAADGPAISGVNWEGRKGLEKW